MSIATLPKSKSDPSFDPVGAYVESFLDQLRTMGYAEDTLDRNRSITSAFAGWAERSQIASVDLNESHVAKFIRRSPRPSDYRVACERIVLPRFLNHAHAQGGVPLPRPPVDSSPGGELERRYAEYLRGERGLAERSLCVYLPLVHEFILDRVANAHSLALDGLDASIVSDFLLSHRQGRSSEQMRLMATSLRSFLGFLFVRGETASDLSVAVPTVRKWSQSTVHPFLSPEQVERILEATDRTSPGGRRDYAILLLLARLGLRAGEVVELDLGDIRWRTGEIFFRGKGRIKDRLPLLSDVGEALAEYIQKDRPASPSRRVFLRKQAPCVGLVGPAAVGHVVRAAFARAGLRPSHRGAAHVFRHSLATRMIRQGASMGEISQILRHRCLDTTAVYAKVGFETLRQVARPWPGKGGAK